MKNLNNRTIIMLLMLLSITLFSCETTVKVEETTDIIDGVPVQIITIDSCEYIYIAYGKSSWGSHKGNCKFCKKNRNNENL